MIIMTEGDGLYSVHADNLPKEQLKEELKQLIKALEEDDESA